MPIETLELGDIVILKETTVIKKKYKNYKGLRWLIASNIETQDNKSYVKLQCIEDSKIKIRCNINCFEIVARLADNLLED